MFGPHLILDGSKCDTQKLGDRILIEQMLNDYPAAIGMTKIGGPYMFEYQAPDPAYSGVSGIVVIAESHIAIHTFPALDYFSMDIFSCKNFDHEKAIRYIQNALDVKQMDRMLVQRGLSFRGPHHGENGATDELIAAAQRRLEAGIVSNETVTAEEAAAARAEMLALRSGQGAEQDASQGAMSQETTREPSAGHMIWPQYGVTPDLGTYGPDASLPARGDGDADGGTVGDANGDTLERSLQGPSARGGARVVALNGGRHQVHGDAVRDVDEREPTEPVQVNPTASISGLLDKLGGVGLGGRGMSQALGEWERMARDPRCALVLALSTPVVAAGLREVLVYLVDRRLVDVVIASGADLFADLYEALGYVHYVDGDVPAASAADRARALAFLTEFASGMAHSPARERQGQAVGTRALLRALGEALPARAPRKGLIQAAAAADIPLYCPDLGASPIGAALLAARADGVTLRLDPLDDLAGLAVAFGAAPRAGLVCVGQGPAAALAIEAHTLSATPSVGDASSALPLGIITLGAPALGAPTGQTLAAVETDVLLALPLVVSGLAQRMPGAHSRRGRVGTQAALPAPEQALA